MGSLRGILRKRYEDYKEREKLIQEEMSKFRIGTPKKIMILPEFNGANDFEVKYTLIEPFTYAKIAWDDEKKTLVYNIVQPDISEEERKIIKKIDEELQVVLDKKLVEIKDNHLEYIQKKVIRIISNLGIELRPGQFTRIMYDIYINFIGLGKLEPLMHDPYIEDIGCDGVNIPIYVTHKKYGNIKTNIVYSDELSLEEFVVKLAERCGRYISYAEPLLDGTLPDGSRVNATLSSDITTKGPTYSIRKFREIPYSCVDLIRLKTVSSELMAYLWFVVEHKSNILIAGGTGAGKTSILNSLVSFIPPEDKVISIEDTRELNLPHENWIPGVSRTGFGTVTEDGKRYGEITMFDLLRESFRENPDYVIVGEVRGKEASVLFQGMASGHPSLGTIHGGSVEDIIKRIETPPISLPPVLVESLDIILVVSHASQYGKSSRRITKVSEVVSVDPDSGKANTTIPFQWLPSIDKHEKRDSWLLNKISTEYGIPIAKIEEEIKTRTKVLNWLMEHNIYNFYEVSKYISMYYKNKENVLKEIESYSNTESDIIVGEQNSNEETL